MKIELLLTEPERPATAGKRQRFHTEDTGVKGAGCLHIGDGKNQMVEPGDLHCRYCAKAPFSFKHGQPEAGVFLRG